MSAVAATYIDVRVAPPPPRHEMVPTARPGYVWAPGYWDWTGRRHVWVNGHWERARYGYVYQQPRWEQKGNHWRYYSSSWVRGDKDRDGIPDAYDHHPVNPHRR